MAELLSALGKSPDTWRAEIERELRRSDRLDEREMIRSLNWGMFGARLDEATGQWSKPEFRIGSCGQPVATDRVTGERGEIDGEPTAALGGVETCASPWACVYCAAKIRGARALEVGKVIRAHLDAGGHGVFTTLTNSHEWGEGAEWLFLDSMDAWNRLTRSRRRKRLVKRLGGAGFIRTTEVTHSFTFSCTRTTTLRC